MNTLSENCITLNECYLLFSYWLIYLSFLFSSSRVTSLLWSCWRVTCTFIWTWALGHVGSRPLTGVWMTVGGMRWRSTGMGRLAGSLLMREPMTSKCLVRRIIWERRSESKEQRSERVTMVLKWDEAVQRRSEIGRQFPYNRNQMKHTFPPPTNRRIPQAWPGWCSVRWRCECRCSGSPWGVGWATGQGVRGLHEGSCYQWAAFGPCFICQETGLRWVFERNVMGVSPLYMSVMQDSTGTYSLITWINVWRVFCIWYFIMYVEYLNESVKQKSKPNLKLTCILNTIPHYNLCFVQHNTLFLIYCSII